MALEDISDGHRAVLEMIIKMVKQTQTILPEGQPSRIVAIPTVRKTMVRQLYHFTNSDQITKFVIHASVVRMSRS